jgi:broad specificity phosphatase PhoE
MLTDEPGARMLRFAICLAILLAAQPTLATEAGWAQLREGGKVVLVTHANAPGGGDPTNFDVENCRTQRNLSDRGRQQARRMGPLFLARAAQTEKVLSSRWCRAFETASIAFGGEPEPFEALDPIPADEELAAERKAAIMEVIREYSGWGNLVMVTHPDTVQALTNVKPRDAEAVIVAPNGDGLQVTGRIVLN